MHRLSSIILLSLFLALTAKAGDYLFLEDYGLTLGWITSDQPCAYTTYNTRVRLFVEQIADNAHDATLSGRGWNLVGNAQYCGYAPYNPMYYEKDMPRTALPISFLGQKQSGNASTVHLTAYDFMASQTQSASDACHFTFQHLAAVLRIECDMTSDAQLASFTIDSPEDIFTVEATMNLTNSTVTATKKASQLSLDVSDIALEKDNKMVLYLVVAPDDISGQVVTLTLRDTEGRSFAKRFLAPKLKPGRCYTLALDGDLLAEETEEEGEEDGVLAKKNGAQAAPVEDVAVQEQSAIAYPTATVADIPLETEAVFRDAQQPGDVNEDGEVNPTDAVMVINYYLGKITSIDRKVADMNEDGEVNPTDAVMIINKYLNK